MFYIYVKNPMVLITEASKDLLPLSLYLLYLAAFEITLC